MKHRLEGAVVVVTGGASGIGRATSTMMAEAGAKVAIGDIHGDLEQVHRQATLDAFKADQVDYLVATDVAARGLDISDMPVVINFDVPFNPDDYVHRIGRTGRAGRSGRAFTFATAHEAKSVSAIERLTGRPIPKLDLAGAVETAEAETPAEAEKPAKGRRMRKREEPVAAIMAELIEQAGAALAAREGAKWSQSPRESGRSCQVAILGATGSIGSVSATSASLVPSA